MRLPFRYYNRKVGGLRFIRIGRLSFSYSISKPVAKPAKPATPSRLVANDYYQMPQARLDALLADCNATFDR